MTCAFAVSPKVTPFDVRVFTLRDCRRVFFGVVIGLGTVAAACGVPVLVIVAAAWIVATTLSTNPYIHASASVGLETTALAYRYPALAAAADVSSPTPVLADRGRAPDVILEAKLAPAATETSAPASTAPLSMTRPSEQASNAPSPPDPLTPPHIPATKEIANIGDAKVEAESTPSTPAGTAPILPPPSPEPAKRVQAAPRVAVATPPPPASTPQKPQPAQPAHNDAISLPRPGSRMAVYDIAAHTVYLPDGERLEAHSGLGRRLDDPRYVSEKARGPTPPNIYDLVLRGQPFHGVRAIRLNPVDESSMFGRDGILAHTYMLGPTGQSFGCVSFKDYPAFLRAFLKGEVDRLVVVPHLGTALSRPTLFRRRHGQRYALDDP